MRMEERRNFKRIRREIRITWKNESVGFDGLTLDICPTGVFVVTNQLLPPKTIVELELWIDSDRPLHCRGKVTWVNRGQLVYYPQGFGMQFLDLERDFISRLLPLCAAQDQEWPDIPA